MLSFSLSFARRTLMLLSAVLALSASANEAVEDRGARIAAQRCAVCHGADGRGISPGYPSLAAQHAEYIVKQIFAFKTGQRTNAVMTPVLEELVAADIRAVAYHFASARAGIVPSSDQTLLAEGRQLYFRGNNKTGISACSSCHGVYGTGGAQMPRLVGQNPVYLEKQLRGFITKVRHNDRLMHISLAAMSDREVKAVSTYLGNEE